MPTIPGKFVNDSGVTELEGSLVTDTAVQSITGALSTVSDAPAKAVLTSIIAALVAYGLATNNTT